MNAPLNTHPTVSSSSEGGPKVLQRSSTAPHLVNTAIKRSLIGTNIPGHTPKNPHGGGMSTSSARSVGSNANSLERGKYGKVGKVPSQKVR